MAWVCNTAIQHYSLIIEVCVITDSWRPTDCTSLARGQKLILVSTKDYYKQG